MIIQRADLIDRLLAVTPVVPPDAEPEQLVRAAHDIVDARDRVLSESGVHDANDLDGPRDEARMAELARRTAAWADALARNRDRVGMTRAGFAKAKAYRQNRQR